jgi:Na+/H+ antiporter NhaD/arsenite permease-like protein
MVSVTIDIAETLKVNLKPYIISEVLASNIGGVATLIGDPPNIMIASAGNLTFMPRILEDIEWSTLIFFSCLFIIVGGLEKTGVIQKLSLYITLMINRNVALAITSILWFSALASSAIDNSL